jgi:hypothetical protein
MTKANRRIFLRALGPLTVSSFVAIGARADDAACKPVWDAMFKYTATPSHTFSTSTGLMGDAKPQKSEMVSTGKSRFVMVDGSWMVNRMTDQEMLDIEKEKARSSNAQCRWVRDEATGGETAALYTVHSETGGTKSDEQVWISHRSGLPLKLELSLGVGGNGGAKHMSSRMVYDNIRAPDGVK